MYWKNIKTVFVIKQIANQTKKLQNLIHSNDICFSVGIKLKYKCSAYSYFIYYFITKLYIVFIIIISQSKT